MSHEKHPESSFHLMSRRKLFSPSFYYDAIPPQGLADAEKINILSRKGIKIVSKLSCDVRGRLM